MICNTAWLCKSILYCSHPVLLFYSVVTRLPTTTKAPPASQKWFKNKQAGRGPKYKRESEGARTFQVSATRFWNSLPNEIKCSSSFEILKKSLFKYFLESYKDVYHFTIA